VSKIRHSKNRVDSKHTNTHHNQEPRAKPSQVKHRGARALNKVIRVGAVAADPVRYGRQYIRGDNEQWVVGLPEGAREDDEQEADGEDEGEGDDGFEACLRHDCGLCCVFVIIE
jgi:hypothetical protein